MKLFNFEDHIPEIILDRGYEYYEQGHIIKFSEENSTYFKAIVEGIDLYDVKIEINDDVDIVNTSCNCPHDTCFCKHVVAVLYMVQDEVENKLLHKENEQSVNLTEILMNLDKEVLVQQLIDIASNDISVLKSLLFKFNENDLVTEVKRLLQSFREVQANYYDEYYDDYDEEFYEDVEQFNKIVADIHYKVNQLIEKKNYIDALNVSFEVLLTTLIREDQIDDLETENNYDDILEWIELIIKCAIDIGELKLATQTKDKICEMINLTSFNRIKIDLCWKLVPFTRFTHLRSSVESIIKEVFLDYESWLDIQLEIYKFNYEERKVQELIDNNLDYKNIRQLKIDQLIELEDYQEALMLINLSIEEEIDFYKWRWKKQLLCIYELLGNTEEYKKALNQYFLEGHYELKDKLKVIYPIDTWKTHFKSLLELLINTNGYTYYILRMAAEEEIKSILYDACQDDNHLVFTYYQDLLPEYKESIQAFFITCIEKQISYMSTRKQYQSLTSDLYIYFQVYGYEQTDKIIRPIIENNQKKRALQEEMSILLKRMKNHPLY